MQWQVSLRGYPRIDVEMEALERQRTDWADGRILLANERTLSAWIRTGLAAVIAGLGIAHLPETRGWPVITRTIGAIFVLSGRLATRHNLVAWVDQNGNSRLMQMKTRLRHFERKGS